MAHSYSGTPYNNDNEQTAADHNDLDGAQKHNAQRREAGTRANVLHEVWIHLGQVRDTAMDLRSGSGSSEDSDSDKGPGSVGVP